MIIIGEKINGSIPAVAEAIANRDAELIKQRAIAQTNAGASYIDCCASVPEAEEVETLKWMIDCIQEVTMSRFPWTAQVQMYWCRPISSARNRVFSILCQVREIRLIKSFQLWLCRKIRTGR